VTIRDVAQKAGVSPGTVSRAINNSPLVNEKTRARIMEAIHELHYVPNLAARKLSIGKTLTIGVIVPFFTRPSVSERLNGLMSALAASHYDLLIHNIETPERRDAGFQDVLRPDRVDGAVIVSLPIPDRYIAQVLNANLPIILVDTLSPALATLSSVTVDDVGGGRVAAQHLIELGHRRIGFVGDIVDNAFHFTSSRDRYFGYCNALNAAGIALRPEYYAEDVHGRREARALAARMLALSERPTAILSASDTQAIGVLEAARELGLRVPKELSVVGYDDIESAEIMGLTTMRQSLFESGQRGAELLLERLEDPNVEPVHEQLPVELVVRSTTAPPAN
jgi:DNA-binding LacI/PurR family transcriptional regulator